MVTKYKIIAVTNPNSNESYSEKLHVTRKIVSITL